MNAQSRIILLEATRFELYCLLCDREFDGNMRQTILLYSAAGRIMTISLLLLFLTIIFSSTFRIINLHWNPNLHVDWNLADRWTVFTLSRKLYIVRWHTLPFVIVSLMCIIFKNNTRYRVALEIACK